MQRLCSRLFVAALLATTASAQCFETNYGVLCPRAGFPAGFADDALFDLQPMNLTFPLGGVASGYTHAHIQSNGVIFLTNGLDSGETDTGYATNATQQIDNLRGTAGAPPRIAPLWRDLVIAPGNGGGVYFNNTIPGKFVVTWADAVQYNTTSPVFTLQAQLFADGSVTFTYSGTTASALPAITGISAGDGIAQVPGVDLSVGGNATATQLIYQRFAGNQLDLASQCLTFSPSGGGFAQDVGLPASHSSYGQGCYDIARESFYELFATAGPASTALGGQSMVLTPTANGYTASWGGGSYVVPTTGATPLAVGDDDDVTVTPSAPFPSPFGAETDLRVSGNAIVALGAAPIDYAGAQSYVPAPATLLRSSRTAFWSWHDYNTTEPGSGDVLYEEVTVGTDTVALVTFDDVESYSQVPQQNRSTLQFQLDLTTGVVTIVWVDVDGNSSSPYGSAHLIGFSPGGVSMDPGTIHLATALPVTTAPDMHALSLTASPDPRSTATAGTTVTYTTSNIPEAAPGSGIYIAAHIYSLAGVPPPGVNLTFLGAPDCFANILVINVIQAMIDVVPTQSVTLDIPAGVAPGFEVFSQSIALVVPFSLPNGQNAFGLVTSNGVRSYVSPF